MQRAARSLLRATRLPGPPRSAWRCFAGQPAPTLVGLSGMPLSSNRQGGSGKTDPSLGPEIQLTAQNASQVLQSKGAILVQLGELQEAVHKKVTKLRSAAAGRLPLVLLDCAVVPQVCQALQLQQGQVAVLLLAQGQVGAALEGDMSAQQATTFVERVAQLLGLHVDLSEGVSEQLAAAEELEWSLPGEAEKAFDVVLESSDLPMDAKVRAVAGKARCALWAGSAAEARGYLDELGKAGHMTYPETKQAAAALWLFERPGQGGDVPALQAAAEDAGPTDVAATEAHAVAAFWAGKPGDAFDAALKALRKHRCPEYTTLVRHLVDALGPRHPRYKKARKAFSNSQFA